MIPPIRDVLGSSAREAAIETTDRAKEIFNSFYSQVSCADLSAIQSQCNVKGGNAEEGAVSLDWRADPFLSMSDLILVVYDGSGDISYHVHTLVRSYVVDKTSNTKCKTNNPNSYWRGVGENLDSWLTK